MRVPAILAVCLVLGASPLSAQSLKVTTPAQDLDCALWATLSLSNATPDTSPQLVSGLSTAMAWFTGLYEGKTGKAINVALKARRDSVDLAEIEAVGPQCVARLSEFSKRVALFGL